MKRIGYVFQQTYKRPNLPNDGDWEQVTRYWNALSKSWVQTMDQATVFAGYSFVRIDMSCPQNMISCGWIEVRENRSVVREELYND